MGKFRKRTPEREAKARELLAAGANWKDIGRFLGLDPKTARCWIDEQFHKKHRHSYEVPTVHFKELGTFTFEPPSFKRDAEERMREILPDTRTEIQRLLGEPPPGRSALDQRRMNK